MSLLALVVMTMSSCLRVKLGENGWSIVNKAGRHNDTPTQVHQVNEVTQMQQFDEIDVAGPFNVILEQGQAATVRVEGTVDQLASMTIYVKDGDLVIDMKEDMVDASKFFKGMRVFVSTPMVESIEIAGSGSVTAPKALAVGDMHLEIAGSGDITLDRLNCKDLDIEIAGSGDIMLSCLNVDQVSTSIAGSGDVILRGNVGTHTEDIAGSGKVDVSGIKK